MSMHDPYVESGSVSAFPLSARLEFIRKTYAHLAASVGAFVAVCALFYAVGVGEKILTLIGGSQAGWLMVLGAFILVGYIASAMANNSTSVVVPYVGLGLYVWMEALIFSPILFLAARLYPGSITSAAAITILAFVGLTFYVFTTKRDFSFLGTALSAGFMVAIGLIVCGVIFGFSLGIWFSGAMVLLSIGSILFTTSRVLHTFGEHQYVGAALELFAAVALMFWYVLRLLMSLRD